MKEAIKTLIEDYESRAESAGSLMMQHDGISDEQFFRVSGKFEAYNGIVRELKWVLSKVPHVEP